MPYAAKNVFSYSEGLVRGLFGLLLVVVGGVDGVLLWFYLCKLGVV